MTACMQCREAFAGSQERKTARETQQQVQLAEELLGDAALLAEELLRR
jgi:hypothetical protein